jgi:hypothetical protein
VNVYPKFYSADLKREGELIENYFQFQEFYQKFDKNPSNKSSMVDYKQQLPA